MFKTLNKWIKTSRPWQTILRFLLVLLTTCTSLIASFSIITFAPPALAANACVPNLFYGSGLGNNKLYTLALATGTPTEIGTDVLQFSTAAISRDSRDGRIYYVEQGSGTNSPRIGYYNPSFPGDSGVLANRPTLTDGAIKMAQQASTGDMFIASGDNIITRLSIDNNNNLFTGSSTIVPNPAIGLGSGDIAFDPNNSNILYLTRQTGNGDSPISLYRIDVTSGVSTLVGTTTQSLQSGSLAFDPNGTLYFDGFVAGTGAYDLYTLSTGNGQATNTGVAISLAGGFPGFSDFGTLPIISPATASASLGIQKTASVDAILPGQPISYKIVVSNTGNCDAVGISLADTISPNITSPTWSSSFRLAADNTQAGTGKMIPSSGSGNINTQFNLSVGSELVVTITGTLSAATAAPSILSNTATLSPPTGVTLNGTPTSTVNTPVLGGLQPDLAIVKSGPATYSRGGNITYTLKVSNVGNGPAVNPVIVADPAPSGSTFVSSSSSVGTCSALPCTFPAATFPVNAVVTITVTFATSLSSPDGLDNVATVSTTGEDGGLLKNNTSSSRAVASGTTGGGGVVPPVTPVVDVAIEITAPASVPPGSNFTVTLTGKNVGTTTADNVVISYDVPPGVTVVSIPAGCVYNASASNIICASIPSFGSGATASYDFVFKAPTTPATLTGIARISTTSPEPNTGNNSAAATTLVATNAPTPSLPPGVLIPPGETPPPGVTPPPVIATGLQASNPPVNNRDGTETVTFTLTITNTGTQTLSNLQAILDLVKTFSGTQGFVVLSINSSDFLVNSSFNGTDLQNLLGSGNVLAPGASGKITFSVRVTPGFNLGPYTATAFVQGTDPNGVIVTSTSTAQAQFTGLPNVRLVKRMTNASRNGVALTNISFNTFVDDPNDSNDNAPGWSALSPVGLSRISESGLLQSGDALEYTVYFLSDGTGVASNFLFCDPIPAGSTFLPDTFGTGQGISLRLNGADTVQTNAADGDAGRFISILSPAPSPCASANNPNGSVYAQIPVVSNRSPNNVGFVRFQVKID